MLPPPPHPHRLPVPASPFPCSVCALKFGSIMRFVAAQTKHDCDTHPSVAMGAHMSLALNCKGGQEQDWQGGGDSCLRQMPSRLPCAVIICRVHTARDAMPPLTSNRQAEGEGEVEGERQRHLLLLSISAINHFLTDIGPNKLILFMISLCYPTGSTSVVCGRGGKGG